VSTAKQRKKKVYLTYLKYLWVISFGYLVMFPAYVYGSQCYIGKACFSVSEPSMAERVCYLYAHESRTYREGLESDYSVTMPDSNLHPDQLHVEFLKLLVQKKFIALKKGTPIFSCRYDLSLLKKNPQDAELLLGPLPEANCSGRVSRFVPIRINNMVPCYWVAEENIQCEDTPPTATTFQETDYPFW
jgi:hypothetical protein